MTDAEGNEIGKLFVGGLSQATNNGSLRLYFSRFGDVDDAVVMMDNKTGRSRGFGYVKYRDSEAVSLALEAKPHIVDGKEVDAKQCNVNMKGRNRRSLKIFVGGIGLDQDVDSIKTYFKQFGKVTDVNLMMDSNKQRHRGFAFVGFEDEAVVKKLINMHYVTINNKQVEIKAMEPPNFGRRVTSNACLPTATLLASGASVEASLGQLSDSNGILTAGCSNVDQYGAAFIPSLQCAQHNPLYQPRIYGHQHHPSYGSNLVPDGLLPTTSYFHPNPSAQPLRPVGDMLSAELSKPMLITNNLFGYPTNTPPFYATVPMLSQSQTSGSAQFITPTQVTLPNFATNSNMTSLPPVLTGPYYPPFPALATMPNPTEQATPSDSRGMQQNANSRPSSPAKGINGKLEAPTSNVFPAFVCTGANGQSMWNTNQMFYPLGWGIPTQQWHQSVPMVAQLANSNNPMPSVNKTSENPGITKEVAKASGDSSETVMNFRAEPEPTKPISEFEAWPSNRRGPTSWPYWNESGSTLNGSQVVPGQEKTSSTANEVEKSRESQSLDYTNWLYPPATIHRPSSSIQKQTTVAANTSECQAGAAGDFARPIHYVSYQH